MYQKNSGLCFLEVGKRLKKQTNTITMRRFKIIDQKKITKAIVWIFFEPVINRTIGIILQPSLENHLIENYNQCDVYGIIADLATKFGLGSEYIIEEV